MRFLIPAIAAACISFGCPAAAEPDAGDAKLSPQELTKALSFKPSELFIGGVTVASGDTMAGPLIVIDGALDIQDGAAVAGDAWIVNGTLILNGSASVAGAVTLVNSAEYLSHEGRVIGAIRRYASECALDADLYEKTERISFVEQRDRRALGISALIEPGHLSRVDYSLVSVGLKRENELHREPYVRARASVHVPLKKESHGFLGFSGEVAIPLFGSRAELLLEGFKLTVTEDDWQLSRLENSFIIALTGDDFADYYEKRGGGIGLLMRVTDELEVVSAVHLQSDLSLEAMEVPSILRSTDRWRENPPVDDGDRFLATLRLRYDTRDDVSRPVGAWMLGLELEKGIADGPGDFSYLAFEADARRYNALPAGLRLDLGARLFSSFDPIPRQLSRWTHGYGGIRGAADDPFAVHRGNRMAVARVELRKQLPDAPGIRKVFTRWSALLFSDVGLVVDEDQERRPLDFLQEPWDGWRKTIGVGISAESIIPYFGLYVAQDLDRDSFEPRIIVRGQRSF
jgi:hypothetical protein